MQSKQRTRKPENTGENINIGQPATKTEQTNGLNLQILEKSKSKIHKCCAAFR